MKRFCLVAILVLMVTSLGFATQTRVMTMGEVDHIIKDDNNIWAFPQTLLLYPDRMVADIMGSNMYQLGAHYEMPCCAMAMYFGKTILVNEYAPNVPDVNGNPQMGADQKIDLFIAKELGMMPLGLKFSLYGNSYTRDYSNPTDKTTMSTMGMGITLGGTFMDNLEGFFVFETYSWTNEDAAGAVVTEPSGNSNIEFGIRYWKELSSEYTIVPYFGLRMAKIGMKDNPGNEEIQSMMTIMVGFGDNIMIDDNVMVVNDIGIEYTSGTKEMTPAVGTATEDKMSSTAIPYFRIGMEADISSKVDVRFGAVKKWAGASTEADNGNKDSWGFADTEIYLGAAVHYGNLDIDAAIDPGFLTRGPYLLSGQSGDMAACISLRYTWGD